MGSVHTQVNNYSVMKTMVALIVIYCMIITIVASCRYYKVKRKDRIAMDSITIVRAHNPEHSVGNIKVLLEDKMVIHEPTIGLSMTKE